MQSYMEGNLFPFHFSIDDPSGNSHVQNVYAPNDDPEIHKRKYKASIEQLH